MEYIVCGARAVTRRILPVEMMVVYKGPVENDAPVGLERACDHVGGVRRCSAISGRARPTFRVRLDNKSPEVRNPTIDRVYFLAPPFSETRIKWIECIQPTNDLGSAQINSYGHPNTPFAEGVSDASEQARVLADARQIGAHLPVLEKD